MNSEIPSAVPSRDALSRSLQGLYSSFGYSRYKMNRFEEYDLYARNKDFLVSDSVITFTDTSGKLMALKPDVTLSIVKNTREESGQIRKLYYKESVYRISERNHSFQELTQVGLEAIGTLDSYTIYEVLNLAAQSLACTGQDCVLEISHLGLLDSALRYAGIDATNQDRIVSCIGSKNRHELAFVCRELQIAPERAALLQELAGIFGTPAEVMQQVNALLTDIAKPEELSQFNTVIASLCAGEFAGLIRIDFSVISPMRYYNGFVFKGYARGIPSAMLSGGQYDRMLRRMGRTAGAIGFAVYLDILEEYLSESREYDVDTLLIYDPACSIRQIGEAVRELTADGSSVLTAVNTPAGLRCRRVVKLPGEVLK